MDVLQERSQEITLPVLVAKFAIVAMRFPAQENLPDRQCSTIPFADGSGAFNMSTSGGVTTVNTWNKEGWGHRRYTISEKGVTDSENTHSYVRPDLAGELLAKVTQTVEEYRSPAQRHKESQDRLAAPSLPEKEVLRTHAVLLDYAQKVIAKYAERGQDFVLVYEHEKYGLMLNVDKANQKVTLHDVLHGKEEYDSVIHIDVESSGKITMRSILPKPIVGEAAWEHLRKDLEKFHRLLTTKGAS